MTLHNSKQQSNTVLYEIIEALTENEAPIDMGQGGVRLAQESAILIAGQVKHAPGEAKALPKELKRYTQLTKLQLDDLPSMLQQQFQNSILCHGQGVELYQDPGDTVEKIVKYGPDEAVKDSLLSAASAMASTKLVYNVLGGDDLILGQVQEALQSLTLNLDIPTKCTIEWNSLCHSTIPSGTCTVTVVNMGTTTTTSDDATATVTAPSNGIEKALAAGQVYLRDGVYYTVVESDINPALE